MSIYNSIYSLSFIYKDMFHAYKFSVYKHHLYTFPTLKYDLTAQGEIRHKVKSCAGVNMCRSSLHMKRIKSQIKHYGEMLT